MKEIYLSIYCIHSGFFFATPPPFTVVKVPTRPELPVADDSVAVRI